MNMSNTLYLDEQFLRIPVSTVFLKNGSGHFDENH